MHISMNRIGARSDLLWRSPHEVLRTRESEEVARLVGHAIYACPRLWIVLSHYREGELEATRAAIAASGATTVYEEEFVGALLVGVHHAPPDF